MFAYWAHVCTARNSSLCQAEELPGMRPNSELGLPSTCVPLGTKLNVRCWASVHGTPNVAGTVRSSRRSIWSAEGRAMGLPVLRVTKTDYRDGPGMGYHAASCEARPK